MSTGKSNKMSKFEKKNGSLTRRGYLGIAGSGAIAGMAGCVGDILGGSDTITLGAAFPFTGAYSQEAETQLDGVELAVDEINENGGLLDREVEVVDRDTELSGDTSTRRVQSLIQNEEIDLLVANLSGSVSLQTNEQASEANVPYMAGCQTIPDFQSAGSPGSFSPYASNVQSNRAMMQYIYENLGESVFGVVADYAWGNSSWEYATAEFERLGGEIEGEVREPVGTSDFSSSMTSARDSDADVLVITNFGSDTANSLIQAREFGLHEEKEIFVATTTNTVAQRAGTDQWEGVKAGIQYYHGDDSDGTQDFKEKMEENYDYPGDSYAAVTYTGVKEFERAIEATESLELEDIASYLNEEEPGFQHTKTEESWRECDNLSVQEWYIVEGKAADEQENDWDLFEVEERIGGEDLLLDCGEY